VDEVVCDRCGGQPDTGEGTWMCARCGSIFCFRCFSLDEKQRLLCKDCQTVMRESTIVKNIMKTVRCEYPHAFVVKLADRHTRGMPDLLILLPGIVLFVEVKAPGGVLRPIQRATHTEINTAGGTVLVAWSADDVMTCLAGML